MSTSRPLIAPVELMVVEAVSSAFPDFLLLHQPTLRERERVGLHCRREVHHRAGEAARDHAAWHRAAQPARHTPTTQG